MQSELSLQRKQVPSEGRQAIPQLHPAAFLQGTPEDIMQLTPGLVSAAHTGGVAGGGGGGVPEVETTTAAAMAMTSRTSPAIISGLFIGEGLHYKRRAKIILEKAESVEIGEMSVTANQLSKSGAKGKVFERIIREQLQVIDDRMQRADRVWGRNIVAHDLPTTFSIPGLQKSDAQRIVYGSILRNLKDPKRGFKVRILLEPDRTVLYTEWETDIDEKDIRALNREIRDAQILPEEVEEYISPGREIAAEMPKPSPREKEKWNAAGAAELPQRRRNRRDGRADR